MKASSSAFLIDSFHKREICAPPELAFSAFGSRSMVCGWVHNAGGEIRIFQLELLINKLAIQW